MFKSIMQGHEFLLQHRYALSNNVLWVQCTCALNGEDKMILQYMFLQLTEITYWDITFRVMAAT